MSICHRISGYKPLTFTRELPANHLSVGWQGGPSMVPLLGSETESLHNFHMCSFRKKLCYKSNLRETAQEAEVLFHEPWVTSLHQKIRGLFVAKFFGAFQLATSACNWARSDSLSAHEPLSLRSQISKGVCSCFGCLAAFMILAMFRGMVATHRIG